MRVYQFRHFGIHLQFAGKISLPPKGTLLVWGNFKKYIIANPTEI